VAPQLPLVDFATGITALRNAGCADVWRRFLGFIDTRAAELAA
jgi:hypothetical protein